MNLFTQQRRCLRTAAVAVSMIAVTACSSGGTAAKTSQPMTGGVLSSTAAKPVTKTAAAAPGSAALAALSKAENLTKALHSYAFRASQQLSGGAKVQQTVLTGRVVRPGAVSYDLSVGGRHQEVIKVGGRTFVRVSPGPWKALSKPGPTVDPITSLLPLLANLSEPVLTGKVLTGKVSAAVLSQAGLAPAGAASSAATPVRFVLDAAGRVTTVTLRLTIKAGTQTLVLDEVTSFTQVNKVAAIKAPGIIK